jgi:hypothetical protein
LCGCREKRSPDEPFCSVVERQAAALPIRVEKTAVGIRFQVAYGGLMLDLYDAIKSYRCRGATARAIELIQRQAARFQALAAPLAGQTVTLGAISRLGT